MLPILPTIIVSIVPNPGPDVMLTLPIQARGHQILRSMEATVVMVKVFMVQAIMLPECLDIQPAVLVYMENPAPTMAYMHWEVAVFILLILTEIFMQPGVMLAQIKPSNR